MIVYNDEGERQGTKDPVTGIYHPAAPLLSVAMAPDSGQDALSLTLPKVGSRTKTKRRKIPKPPKGKLLWVLLYVVIGLDDALNQWWISFGIAMFMLGAFWIEMLVAMRLRRAPWWHRGPAEAITFLCFVLGVVAITIITGD